MNATVRAARATKKVMRVMNVPLLYVEDHAGVEQRAYKRAFDGVMCGFMGLQLETAKREATVGNAKTKLDVVFGRAEVAIAAVAASLGVMIPILSHAMNEFLKIFSFFFFNLRASFLCYLFNLGFLVSTGFFLFTLSTEREVKRRSFFPLFLCALFHHKATLCSSKKVTVSLELENLKPIASIFFHSFFLLLLFTHR